MFDEVNQFENLALKMGFQREDIILFESLTTIETVEALIYGWQNIGLCKQHKTLFYIIYVKIKLQKIFVSI